MGIKSNIPPRLIVLIIFSLLWVKAEVFSHTKDLWGVGFSHLSGSGISYLTSLDKNSSIEINGFAFYTGKEVPRIMQTYGNIGLGYQYYLHKSDLGELSLNPAASFWYVENRDYVELKENDRSIIVSTNSLNRILNLGVNLNYEFDLGKKFHLTTKVGTFHQITNKNNIENFLVLNGKGNKKILFTYGVFLHYSF